MGAHDWGILVTVGSQSEMLRLDRATNLLGPVRSWKRPAFWGVVFSAPRYSRVAWPAHHRRGSDRI